MRHHQSRQVKDTFAIICDGECEVWYFQMLKRNERDLNVNIEPRIPQKKSLGDQFKLAKSLSEDYTRVSWIIDFDVILSETRTGRKGATTPFQSFVEYKKIIEADYKNVLLILNNPCLEFWLLQHFEDTCKPFNDCNSAQRQLKKHLKDYAKTSEYFTKQDHDIYLKLKPYLNIAILNAKKCKDIIDAMPSNSFSQMPLFFEAEEFGERFIPE